MSAVDTAYEMWGVAQPGIPKTKPTKYLTHDCHKAAILTIDQLQRIINSLQSGPKTPYQEYWLNFYQYHINQRKAPK